MSYFEVKAVSNTALGKINPQEDGSPAYYNAFMNGEVDSERKSHFNIGDDLHEFFLEPQKYHCMKSDRPSAMLGDFADDTIRLFQAPAVNYNTESTEVDDEEAFKYAKAMALEVFGDGVTEVQENKMLQVLRKVRKIGGYYGTYKEGTAFKKIYDSREYIIESLANLGKRGMTKDDKATVEKVKNSLYADEKCAELLTQRGTDDILVFNEREVYWNAVFESKTYDIPPIEFPCKAKIDKLIIDLSQNVIIEADLKSTGYPLVKFGDRWRGEFVNRRYYRQRSFYRQAVEQILIQEGLLPMDNWVYESYMIVAETKNQFQAGAFPVNDGWLEYGDKEITSLMDRIAFATHTGDWRNPVEKFLNNGYMPIDPVMNN